MTRLPMSRGAAALLRALITRAAVDRDRILLSEVRSVDWASLTFAGERHQIQLRLYTPQAEDVFKRLTEGLEDAEFAIAGWIVADIRAERISGDGDQDIGVRIEALTIAE